MKKLLIIFLLCFSAFSSFAGGPIPKEDINQIYADIDKYGVESLLKIIANELSTSTPMQLDSITVMDSAIVIRKKMLVSYTLDSVNFVKLMIEEFHASVGDEYEYFINHPNFNTYLENVMWISNATRNCNNLRIGALLRNGASIEHAYYDESGRLLFSHVVDGQDCISMPTIDEIAIELFSEPAI